MGLFDEKTRGQKSRDTVPLTKMTNKITGRHVIFFHHNWCQYKNLFLCKKICLKTPFYALKFIGLE
jgi:hypothetical protein